MGTVIEIQHADPVARRRALIAIGVGALAALIVVLGFRAWLDRLVAGMHGADLVLKLRHMIGLSSAATAVCVLLLALYCARMAHAIVSAHRWPLPGTRVVRDTPIRMGRDALRFGRAIYIASVTLLAVALGFAMFSVHLLFVI